MCAQEESLRIDQLSQPTLALGGSAAPSFHEWVSESASRQPTLLCLDANSAPERPAEEEQVSSSCVDV